MLFNMKMFEAKLSIAANRSMGYESVLQHRHSFVELVYVESGEGTQKLDTGQKMPLKKGDVFIIADDTQHSIRPTCEESEFRIVNILFEKEEIGVDYDLFKTIQPKNFPIHHPVVQYIYNCLEDYEGKIGAYELRMKGWIYLILSEYLSFDRDKRNDKKRPMGVDYVRDATRYIHENYNEKLNLSVIAEKVGVTSGYLQRLFRENCKTSVIEYLLRYRMENACKMLVETDLSIQEISVSIGFSDVKNFYYRFKRIFGVTPSQYRLNHQKEENE
jgi:AraC-like DNA-binding protein